MSFAYLVSLLLLGSIAFALVREMRKASPRPAGLRGHIRARGWGLALLPIALMAEGRSNAAIAQRLFITEKAVSKHAAGIFGKLGLEPSEDDNRRVLAVLAYLGS